ncbi:MAG: N-6 DNA methylase, partial [Sulfurimonas sp.]|nr:N-6 DNA methylase [Sulfurimonas sp.]
MDILQLEIKLQTLVDNFKKEDFIFDFLLSYEMPKANVARLRKNSDVNTLDINGELTVKNKKLFFKEASTQELDSLFAQIPHVKKGLRFIIVTDFVTLKAIDTSLQTTLNIAFDELPKNSDFFWPLAGVERATVYDEKEADVRASIKMAKLYEELKKENPTNTHAEIHALNVFLTRLLFCYFAEDTDIFAEENQFTNYIKAVSKPDGSDLDVHIEKLFETLNSQERNISSHLKSFPYVNGGLFRERFGMPRFSAKSRKLLIECGGDLNWSQINPDIFGSMIQAVVSEEHRGGMGMHYTSVPNIMKVINPLFLEELHAEFENAKGNFAKLNKLHQRITNLKIFDPACGSGNFLIIAYKELRELEMKIFESGGMLHMPSVKLSQFYGIELDDFAHEVAILSLWLAEHQMNQAFKKKFGDCTPTLPLKNGGNIVQGNATRLDWAEVCPKEEGDEIYILGNPPYLGYSERDKYQKDDMDIVFNEMSNSKRLDYIGCWFKKATDYISNLNAKYAFVSTNSISQGEQVSLIWPYIFSKNQEIYFAHQSFKWSNNAKDRAGVTVVIIGIRNKSNDLKILFKNEIKQDVKNISPYLIQANNMIMYQVQHPISDFPEMQLGSSGIDGGNLILSTEEKNDFIDSDINSNRFIKLFIGGADFLRDTERYCIWIDDNKIEEANQIIKIQERIKKCREYRLSAGRDAKKAADVAHRFFYRKYKNTSAIILPMTSSSRRDYLPIGITNKDVVISNGMFMIYDFELYIFGVLSSKLHNLWMSITSARMRNDYRYSVNLTYNTFPFPKITQTQKDEIEELVHAILDERDKNYLKTMAELYDPNKMPELLKTAHHNLDIYIEKCYREQPFESDEERLEHLFKLYEKMIKEE